MADDVTIGSGATTPLDVVIAADEIAGKKFQRVKLAVGDDGTAVDVGASQALPVSVAVLPPIVIAPATTATITRTASSASNVANLVALNTGRYGLVVVNESTATLYVKYGTTAALTDYTYSIGPGVTWEMPHTPRYTGRIDGIWSAANGFAQITELSA